MKLTGKEDASLCIEENGKPYLTFSQLNWNQLLNIMIIDRIYNELQENNNIKKFVTRYITIDKMKISSKSVVNVKFKVILKENIPCMKNCKYDAVNKFLEVKDFYNYIIELFEFYAYELDTDMNNIQLELVNLEYVKGKPLIRLDISCADNDYFNDYIDTIKKYSTDDIYIKKIEYGYCAEIYVESLDFLLQFVEDIKSLNASEDATHDGFIFTMIEKGYYRIEIYNGWRE